MSFRNEKEFEDALVAKLTQLNNQWSRDILEYKTEEELIDVLKIACAYDFVMKLGGLDHEIGGRDKRLSEGQAQRLAVARALLKKAPILLLDEATSALDRETEEKMLNNLMSCDYLRTCILVTHRDSALRICSKNFVIRDGSLNQGE